MLTMKDNSAASMASSGIVATSPTAGWRAPTSRALPGSAPACSGRPADHDAAGGGAAWQRHGLRTMKEHPGCRRGHDAAHPAGEAGKTLMPNTGSIPVISASTRKISSSPNGCHVMHPGPINRGVEMSFTWWTAASRTFSAGRERCGGANGDALPRQWRRGHGVGFVGAQFIAPWRDESRPYTTQSL